LPNPHFGQQGLLCVGSKLRHDAHMSFVMFCVLCDVWLIAALHSKQLLPSVWLMKQSIFNI